MCVWNLLNLHQNGHLPQHTINLRLGDPGPHTDDRIGRLLIHVVVVVVVVAVVVFEALI